MTYPIEFRGSPKREPSTQRNELSIVTDGKGSEVTTIVAECLRLGLTAME
jgi:hypothetical protein